jgi:PhzF family phenazine biosynthesis protein
MKSSFEVYHIDSFTNKPFSGNPAGVMFASNLSTEFMQKIAREINLSETAFLSESKNADYLLRWFTPKTEVDLCGHATIASLHFLFEKGILKPDSKIIVETRSGNLICGMTDDTYYMQIPVPQIKEYNGCKEDILSLFGLDRVCFDDKIPLIISQGGYLYIFVNQLADLFAINADIKGLNEITSKNSSIKAYAVFSTETVEKSSTAHLRFFAPYFGIDEDPGTGSAIGPLILVMLKAGLIKNPITNKRYMVEQGDAINRQCRVQVSFDEAKNELMIYAQAVSIIKGELFF